MLVFAKVAKKAIPVLLAAVVLAGLAVVVMGKFSVFGTTSESRNSLVVRSISREEQVVLVSMGIQGISTRKDSSDIGGWSVPGTSRTTFLQYEYDAKLGIDGKDVTIEESGPDAYVITIPEFMFIGHDDPHYETIVEDNGVLSAVTSDIDEAEMITEILNEEAKAELVADQHDLLKDQAAAFYSGIIRGVDPAIRLEFEYAS